MSVSLQEQQLTKGDYFVMGKHLYYVIDVMPDGDPFLIEECMVNESRWIEAKRLKNVRRVVIDKC
jgi:hypothetical protein